MTRRAPTPKPRKRKLSHDSIRQVRIADCWPSPENDRLYKPVDPGDPEVIRLAESIAKYGVKEPLVVTLDGYILSGHRRFVAAQLAGLECVPVRCEQIRRTDNIDEFVRLLREYNLQREKTRNERLREEIVSADPDEAYTSLIEHRRKSAAVNVQTMELVGTKRRARITNAKKPFLDAILGVIECRRDFWPLSDRQIHYGLLNDPPLRHASKPSSRYDNTRQSYKALVELLTRARLEQLIPWEAIADETRPVVNWEAWCETGAFIHQQVNTFLKGYCRDLMQSQPNHIEVIGEKNTVAPILTQVVMKYCIPLTTGRGYCSLPPRYEMAQRFRKSGKEKLILLLVSDFDPDGEEIGHSFARSMRDDFGIENVQPIKVALTAEQVERLKLPPMMQAKESSVHHRKFTERYGENVFELEAIAPEMLQSLLQHAIDSVIDVDAFNEELDAERRDATFLVGVRGVVRETLDEMDLDDSAA
jgi:hypothetical protein